MRFLVDGVVVMFKVNNSDFSYAEVRGQNSSGGSRPIKFISGGNNLILERVLGSSDSPVP